MFFLPEKLLFIGNNNAVSEPNQKEEIKLSDSPEQVLLLNLDVKTEEKNTQSNWDDNEWYPDSSI